MAGQIIKRGERNFTVRIYMGRDADGRRDYMNQTVRGSKKDAQALLHKLLREKDMGTLLEPSRESLNDYLDRWLEAAAKPRLRASSYGDYERLLKYYIRSELGATPLQKLTALNIRGVRASPIAIAEASCTLSLRLQRRRQEDGNTELGSVVWSS